jgi:hypothetical protein
MDIRNSGPDRAQQSFEQKQRALIDQNRAFLRAARENLAAIARRQLEEVEQRSSGEAREVEERKAHRDEIVLSAAARAALEPSTAEREARVRELAEAHRMERLHTPERLERAAQRLLEG